MDGIICEFAETCKLPSCHYCPVKKEQLKYHVPLVNYVSRHTSGYNLRSGSVRIEGDYVYDLTEDQLVKFGFISEWITLLDF